MLVLAVANIKTEAEEAAGPSAVEKSMDGRSSVLEMLYGVDRAPFDQKTRISLPFNKFATVSRTIDRIRQIDRCKYEIDATVASDDAMAAVGGKWLYTIDFGKVSAIDVRIADNAYEALSWSPIMFLYPAQREMARHHKLSKVFRVTLQSNDKASYCGSNLSSGKPPVCFGGKAFEIATSQTTIVKIDAAVRYFKTKLCKGTAATSSSVLSADFPLRGKWAPSVQQCRASGETDADDSIVFEKNTIRTSDGPPCIAKSISVSDGVISSVEYCGRQKLNRRTKIVDRDHIVLNFGEPRFATTYIKCDR